MEDAAAAAVHARNALALEGDDLAGLGAGRHFDVDGRAVRELDLCPPAERRFGEGDLRAREEIRAFALETLVWEELDVDVKIAGRAAQGAGHALARDAQSLAAV